MTTTLELELGTSDVDAWYRERSAGQRINYGVSIGHIKVRMSVMNDPGTFMPVGDGAYAARVVDRSTYREPSLPPVGIEHVIVNGVSVVANGRAVEGVAPGKPLRAPITSP